MIKYKKEDITKIINDKELLKKEIIESKGFILYLAKKYNINLSNEILIETINNYSINFISEDIKLRTYTKEQIAIVVDFLQESKDNSAEDIKIKKYSLVNLLEDLSLNKEIPKNASLLLKLSFKDFLENQQILCKLLDTSDDDYWADYFNGYVTHSLLVPVFKKISKEDFLKIDKKILGTYPSLYSMAKHLMNDVEIKKSFNESIQFYHNLPEIKDAGYKPKLENYKNYIFEKNEKDLFISLLENSYNLDYEKIKRYKGFENFFTKKDYILNKNIESIKYLSEKEIKENLIQIREAILKKYIQFKNMDFIYNLKIEEKSFKYIFDKDFIKNMIEVSNKFYFTKINNDNKNKLKFINYIAENVVLLSSEDQNILKLVKFQNIINNYFETISYNNLIGKEYINSIKKILSNFDKQLNSELIFNNLEENKNNLYLDFYIQENIINKMQKKESINYLFFLMKITSNDINWKNKEYKKEIDRIIPLLNKDDVISLSKILKYKINKKILKDNPRQEYENNFLNINKEIIEKMSFENFKENFKISKDFREIIIKNDLDLLLIYHTKNNKDYDFIGNILNNIQDDKSEYLDFMKKFIKKNKNFMIENYFEDLITHKFRDNLIKIDTKDIEINAFSKIEKILNVFSEISLTYNDLEVKRDLISKNQKKDIEIELKLTYQKKKKLEEEINENVKNISFEYFSNQIKESNPIKAIQIYNIVGSKYKDIINEKIESLDFQDIKDLLEKRIFLNFCFLNKYNPNGLKQNTSYLTFNQNFTDKENIELVELMLKNFNNKDLFLKKWNLKNVTLNEILYLIKKENKTNIINDLVVKHDPYNMFNSYNFVPQSSSIYHKNLNVTNTFSLNQIIEAIENLNKQGKKIISDNDRNSSYYYLLSNNYNNIEKKDEYLLLLKYLEKDPINYLACIHSDIIINLIEKEKFVHKDLGISEFYNRYINTNVVIDGMKEVFKIHKEYYSDIKNEIHDKIYKGISLDNSLKAIFNFISYTYFYSTSKNSNLSEFEVDKSKEILRLIVKEAPYLCFSINCIGKLGEIRKELSENFKEYYYDNIVEEFFINSNSSKIKGENFSINYDKKNNYWQSQNVDSFINNLIEFLTVEKKEYDLYKLDYILKTYKFLEQEFNYNKELQVFSNDLSDFISNKEYENKIEKSITFIELENETQLTNEKLKKRKKI